MSIEKESKIFVRPQRGRMFIDILSSKISKDSSPGEPGSEWHRFKVDGLGQSDVVGEAANITLLFYTDHQLFRPEGGIFIIFIRQKTP